jgi:hypothetical protein
MWAIGIHLYKVKLPWVLLAKVVFISVVASLTAHYVAVQFAPLWGILCGGSAALVALFGLVYLMRVLKPEDRDRFNLITGSLPKRIAAPVNTVILLLIRTEFAG